MLQRLEKFNSHMQLCGQRVPLTLLGSWLSALRVDEGGNYTPFHTSVVESQRYPGVILRLIESRFF